VITIKIRREYKYRDMMCEMYIVIVAVGDKKRRGGKGRPLQAIATALWSLL
jgi:hypothetical protein